MSTKRMLIDTTHAEETRVVVVSGNRLEDFDVEVESKRQLKSNIYLAKVTRVEPSLQAAFVDFGGNRHGFLSFSEIHPDYYQIPVADREAILAEQREAVGDDNDDDDDASTDEASVESVGGDDSDEVEARRPAPSRKVYKIQEVIKRRQILLVQVVKEERGNKGAALTSYISLPGRYCVLMPNTARGGGISRKIANTTDRRRLKSILKELEIPAGVAVIVRTAGSTRTKAEIKRDYDYLMRLWNQVRETTLDSIAPCVVYEEGNLIKRSIRDLYSKDIEEIVIDGNEGYRTAKDFMKLLIPSHTKRVQPYKDEAVPLFHRYQVESQLDAMHEPTVQLKSGGYLVINQTEALVAIDVNSGRATKERNIEETALQTNMEAAEEVARQLRLRDLAGLVVIDFIDMEIHRNQVKVERMLKDAMKHDRARIQIGRISPFGLMELSRQRLRPSLMESSTEPCPHCQGTGAMRSVGSAALSIIRAIEEEGMRGRSSSITVHMATNIALYILNQKRAALADIETRYNFSVFLASDDSLIAPDHRIDRIKSETAGENHLEQLEAEAETSDDDDASKKRRRRRPRRRRGGGGEDEVNETSIGENTASEEETAKDAVANEGEGSGGDEEAAPKKRRRGRRGGRRRSRSREGEANENTQATDSNAPNVAEGSPDAASSATSEPSTSGVASAATDNDDVTSEDGPKKRRPRRRRSNASEAANEDTANVSVDAPANDDAAAPAASAEAIEPEQAEDKPKRVRRSRKKIVEPEAEVTAVSPAVTAEPVVAQVVEAAPAQPEQTAAVASNDSAEAAEAAKTNVIVVGADAEDKPAETKKGGWWRR